MPPRPAFPLSPLFRRRSPLPHKFSPPNQTSKLSSPRRLASTDSSSERINRVLKRLPRFLHPYTSGLRNAPVTHVVSFLILHELTAIVPLLGLAGVFHWAGWIPDVLAGNSSLSEGIAKFGRYFARKGWFGFSKTLQDPAVTTETIQDVEAGMTVEERVLDVKKEGWSVGEGGSRILVEVATAYAITKVLLPVRVVLSVWATPWFARNVLGGVRRVFGRKVSGEKGVVGKAGKTP